MTYRRGSALIMAVALLAALLLLGLPFLFMQSSSLAGARSLAAKQQAQAVVEGLRAYGVAVGAAAVGPAVIAEDSGSATQAWTSLVQTVLRPDMVPGSATDAVTAPNRLALALGSAPSTGVTALTALSIEDEQGKLDANRLGPAGWTQLFNKLGIQDWDDASVQESPQRVDAEYEIYFENGQKRSRPDNDNIGQLINDIIRQRSDHGPFHRVEDLLLADPGYNTGSHPIFRSSLTFAEIELLRPHLTFVALPQARGGVIDGGTIIGVDPSSYNNLITDSSIPFGVDSWLISEKKNGNRYLEAVATIKVNDGKLTFTGYWSNNTSFADLGKAILLAPAASVNLHQATDVVRRWWPVPLPAAPMMPGVPIAGRGENAWLYTNPLWNDGRERPQLDIASSGWFALTARADILDRAGNLLASAERRQVVQAVPQEAILERRWWHQDDLEFQRRARTMPGMTSWPVAVERFPDLAPHSGGVVPGGDGLTFAPLTANTWTLPATTDPMVVQTALQGTLSDSGKKVDKNQAAKLLTPDGLRLNHDDDPNVRLTLAASKVLPSSGKVALAFWVRPDIKTNEPWPAVVPLLDTRCRKSMVVWDLLGSKDGDPYGQNQFGIYYEHDPTHDSENSAIVMTYSPPGVGITSSLPLIQGDDPGTPLVDERCLAGVNPPFDGWGSSSPLLQPPADLSSVFSLLTSAEAKAHRVVRFYATPGGLTKGQWYYLQILITGSRPDEFAIVVDGCVGRGTQRMRQADAPNEYKPAWGDQCTLPAVILDSPKLPKATNADLTWVSNNTPPPFDSYWINEIQISIPAQAAQRGLTVDKLLPSSGVIVIDDEYISYTKMIPANNGASAILKYCRRAVRGSIPSDHRRDAVVLVDGIYSGKKYDGAFSFMKKGLAITKDAVYSEFPSFIVGPSGSATTPASVDTSSSALPWPSAGIVKINQLNNSFIAYRAFKKSATSGIITLLEQPIFTQSIPAELPGLGDSGSWSGVKSFSVTLCTVEIESDASLFSNGYLINTNEGGGFNSLIQIGDSITGLAHGNIEWMTISGIVKIDERIFAFKNTDDRGAYKTPRLSFNAGAIILPVQRYSPTGFRTGDMISCYSPNKTPFSAVIRYRPEVQPGDVDSIVIPMAFDRAVSAIQSALDGWPLTGAPDPAHPLPTDALLGYELYTGFGWPTASVGDHRPFRFDAVDDIVVGRDCNDNGYPVSLDGISSLTAPSAGVILQAQNNVLINEMDSQFISSSTSMCVIGIDSTVNNNSGLAIINGEVVAWRKVPNSVPVLVAGQALEIIGRGLLGSSPLSHDIESRPSFFVIPGWRSSRVASGPKGNGQLSKNLSPGARFDIEGWNGDPILSFSDLGGNGPFLFCDPTGREENKNRIELMHLALHPDSTPSPYVNPGHFTTANWLRGLYGTKPIDWDANYPPPLVLAWTPRYPSALPAMDLNLPADPDDQHRLLRSRVYPSAGFPVRWHDMRLPKDPVTELLADPITWLEPTGGLLKILNDTAVLSDAADEVIMRPELRFLACVSDDGTDHRFDNWSWDGSDSLASLKTKITLDTYPQHALDGAELRVSWRYKNHINFNALPSTDPYGFRALAKHMNRTPALAGASLRAQVPVRTLAVEGSR